MRENIIKLTSTGIEWVILATLFLLPLLWLPSTTDFFEFNKQYFLYIAASVILLLWIGKILAEGRVVVSRTPLDLFILIFLGAYVLATIFSVDLRSSLWGTYPRLHGGLVSVLGYLVFYFAIIHHIKERVWVLRLVWAMLSSGVCIALLGLAHFWGAALPLNWQRLGVNDPRFFSFTGSADGTAVWVGMLFLLALGFLIAEKNMVKRLILMLAGFVFLGYISSFFLMPVVVPLFLATLLFFTFFKVSVLRHAFPYVLPLLFLGILIFAVNLPFMKKNIPYIKNFPTRHEVRLDHQTAWVITSSAFPSPKLFLAGSGPGTFTYDFSLLKPFIFNSSDLWSLRFVKSSNEIFHLFSTIGFLGVGAFVAIGVVFFKMFAKVAMRSGDTKMALGFGVGVAAFFFFVLAFFTTSLTTTAFYWWALLALTFAIFRLEGLRNITEDVEVSLAALPLTRDIKVLRTRDFLPPLLFLTSLVLLGGFWFFAVKYYIAEVSYRRALVALFEQRGDVALERLRRARSLAPSEEEYLISLSTTSLNVARSFIQSKRGEDLTDRDKETILILLEEARVSADFAAGFHPASVRAWENRGDIYQNLALFGRTGAEDVAIDSYVRARRLDPFNPRVAEVIGMTYFNIKNDPDRALENLRSATTLKYDYFSPHYNIARLFVSQKKHEEARREYDLALEFLPKTGSSENIARVREQITRERDALGTASAESTPLPEGEANQ